jgi:general secretion pathway protein B
VSFILDALRKSETERQRQAGPGLVDAGYRPPARRRGVWLPLLVVVLAANLVLMGIFWLRREPRPANAATAAVPAAGAQPTVTPAVRPPAAATPDAGAEAQFAAIADMPAVDEPPVTEVLEPPPEPAVQVRSEANTGPAVSEDLPTAEQLVAEGALSIPALHLDIHVFSPTPAERFVFINTRRYIEGAQMSEGPRVEEIREDGVVLSVEGRRFLLTRD